MDKQSGESEEEEVVGEGMGKKNENVLNIYVY